LAFEKKCVEAIAFHHVSHTVSLHLQRQLELFIIV